jgi:hypothetical protein
MCGGKKMANKAAIMKALCCLIASLIVLSGVPSSVIGSTTGDNVEFRGVVTWKSSMLGAVHWTVNVDEWISGSISCDEINVGIIIVPDGGSFDPDISTGDRVEVYGKVNPWGDDECSVGLNGESYYYIKKV